MRVQGRRGSLVTKEAGATAASVGGVGLGLCRIDFDAALEVGAVFDADAGSGNIADDGAVLADIDAAAGAEIADDRAEDDDFAGFDFGIERGGRADGELVSAKRDGAFDLAVDLEIFGADDLAFDPKRRTDTRGRLRTGAGRASGSRSRRRCAGSSVRLLRFVPHESSQG